MKTQEYELIERYMLDCMSDSAHDKDHIYRVLYIALDIAEYEKDVDHNVLIAACLLHDIGRQEQFDNPQLCHAAVGAIKAHDFLVKNGFDIAFANRVASCIRAHRYRGGNPPIEIEEKILFDSDKIDVTGTIGIARTIFYKAQIHEPLYSLTENGYVADGTDDLTPSFFQEYKFKLEGLYTRFYTKRGKEIAMQRQYSAKAFYESMLKETQETYQLGKALVDNWID